MSSQHPPVLEINPPLVNSANPWATTLQDLTALYNCPYTGAVTTRTSLLESGFDHDPSKHQFTLFSTSTHQSEQDRTKLTGLENASLNTLGYSPFPLETYLGFIQEIARTSSPSAERPGKGFIISVTGTPTEVAGCYKLIAQAQDTVPFPLAMEVNLSCPNIPGKPPPAYTMAGVLEYLKELQAEGKRGGGLRRVPYGLKTPPYTQASEYEGLLLALQEAAAEDGFCPVSFITATNTLGGCLVLSGAAGEPALPGAGIGGMAGAPLHPLALGNVRNIRHRLDEGGVADRRLKHIQIIGTGGVLDTAGYKRMRAVGANFVGVGTGLGTGGVGIFEEIMEGL